MHFTHHLSSRCVAARGPDPGLSPTALSHQIEVSKLSYKMSEQVTGQPTETQLDWKDLKLHYTVFSFTGNIDVLKVKQKNVSSSS